ncbi:hypothetical protein [Pseudomonas syringae]|nr:hypothetical protein [Pseudomonas syringae]MDH4602495.1 hypothetical protein [Pseudomonas syringae pv. papulans]
MSGDDKSITDNAAAAPLTTDRLHNLVLDHLLENSNVYLSNSSNMTERLLETLMKMTELATQIATESLANRQNLTDLRTFEHLIPGNPDTDPSDGQRYELRYRIIEQIGNADPFNDQTLTLDEADEKYGLGFVDLHWGVLGEKCPGRIVTAGDRVCWFTVCRFPVSEDVDQSVNIKRAQRPRSFGM